MSPGSRSWSWSCWLTLTVFTAAMSCLELENLFKFGEEAGDQQLQPGTNSTEELELRGPLLFFKGSYDKLYINTNGFVAFAQPPEELEYLGTMPASFQMIAALQGDLDNSDGQGKVHFRQDSSTYVLDRAAQHIKQSFPSDIGEEPTNVIIITWENMAAFGAAERGDSQRNTFQLVIVPMVSVAYVILLYPRNGLQYHFTTVGGERKVLLAGFNEGEVPGWFGWTKPGTYHSITNEETPVSNLTEKTNSGQRGVWVYEIGATPFFLGIIPGMATDEEDVDDVDVTNVTIPGVVPEEEQFTTANPTVEYEDETATPTYYDHTTEEPEYEEIDEYEPEYTDPETVTPRYRAPTGYPDRATPTHPESAEPSYTVLNPRYPIPSTDETPVKHWYPDSRYPDPDPVKQRYNNPGPARPAILPPHSRPHHPQIVVVDEDEDFDVNVFAYNLETCANNRQKCSTFADCRDYSSGYCCHCRPGFYGNGRDCVAEGKPQRMNGKVNGRVFVGDSTSPLELSNNDLHSYVVANDGRAYVAISHIDESLGPSMRPLSSLGGIIGWAFALEQPGYENGFSLIGGLFTRQAEVIFQPGNERLSIKQEFKGIDEHDHLVVSTELEGRIPAIQPESSVHINPYKEIYQYSSNLITSSSNRDYTISSPDGSVQTRSYHWRQTITFNSCPHNEAIRTAPSTQQLSVDQIFVLFDATNKLIRYATSNKIGSVHSSLPEQNPCFTGRHGCDINAVCRPGEGPQFICECVTGFSGDGHYCHDIDECRDTHQCGSSGICSNLPGTFRCECVAGFALANDGRTCVEENRPVDHCQRASHDCDPHRARCSYTGGSTYMCSCLPGFEGDGRVCQDVDECQQGACHRNAFCSNTEGSYSCQCHPGHHGDGFHCSPTSTEPEKTQCERHREKVNSFFSFLKYVPQCDEHGAYNPTQCHSSIGQCWCVDANGLEIPNTRTGPGSRPLCIDHTVTPAPVGPTPRPDVSPLAPGTHLLFAQSGKIEHVPLDGYNIRKEESKPLLHIPDRVVIAVAYDCLDKMVYWTDITGPAISKASLSGGDIIPVVTQELESPEGIAIDHVARLMFWTDSMRDTVEVAKLDGSQRRVLFDTDLINPRPIVTNPAYGRLYWADWNRDGPKIEMSNMDGTERTILVKDDLGLPNGLTFDLDSQQLCWADAGTRKVECVDAHGRQRRQIIEGVQYPFSLVSFGRNLYYTDWRREAVVSVEHYSGKETQEFLPQKRSRLYGITTTPTQCKQAYNYCSNNGGCSHLCLPRLGGFTCRCPDAAEGHCVERNL
ncbi:nidogen-1-like [Genypterus blacodes]|uniref:nidogen-1-like n=1 Tax=Genypterus blacodes TaxID=154954 RepID=UPI003F75A0CC